ncbi:hypothetical protein QQF64_008493 [Cirrhinus molitorella]|uniref:Uncharacterized protein n=1 Tax=Cirrhinus molitorella TaxID=172907 RepID=A0ABR3M8T8_9TELE
MVKLRRPSADSLTCIHETSLQSCVFKPVACQGSSTCSDISCCRYRVTLREGAHSCGAPAASAGLARPRRAGAVLFRPGVLQTGRLRLRTAAEERRGGRIWGSRTLWPYDFWTLTEKELDFIIQ